MTNPIAKIPPRLLTMRQASSYWGVSYNTFRKLVREGIAPQPLDMTGLGRLMFDRLELDAAIDARGKRGEVA